MEKLLRKEEIAAMLGTSPGVAASVLEQRGVHPIDWGRGRGRGPRWLASAVEQTLRDIHAAAQSPFQGKIQTTSGAKRKQQEIKNTPHLVCGKSVAELHAELTAEACVQ